MSDDPAILLVRPLYAEYRVVGSLLVIWGGYLYMSNEEEFVEKCMMLSNGFMNPSRIREIYRELMKEAGL